MYNEIEIIFKKYSKYSGNIIVLSPEDALSFLTKAQDKNYVLLGLDGFFLNKEGIRPSQDNSVTYNTNTTSNKDAFEKAKEFIKKRKNIRDLHFEVVIASPKWLASQNS